MSYRKRRCRVEVPRITEIWRAASVLGYSEYVNPYDTTKRQQLVGIARDVTTLVSFEEVFGPGLLEKMESSMSREDLAGNKYVQTETVYLTPEKIVPCELCSEPTPMTGTQRCDRCYELEKRITDNLDLAKLIVERVDIERRWQFEEQRDRIKKRAYEIDPECWVSYSGKDRTFKRYMDKRRTQALRAAEKEAGLT